MPLNLVAKAAIAVALQGAQMALTMSRKIEGQRLDDLKFTQGDYNAPLGLIWGTRRIQGNIFWAEELTEVRRRRKTKGGKFNDYTYFGTWAVAVAGHEIDAVTRIWADTHLIYDATGAGPLMPFGFGDARPGTSGSDYITVYTGSETQDADPRMKATVEAQFGVGSCPAYRGTAYVMFKDIPLEKFGNRIPQMSIEVASGATLVRPYEAFATIAPQPSRLWGFTFSPDYTRIIWGYQDYEIWDVPSRTRLISGTFAEDVALQETFGIYADGSMLVMGDITPLSGPQYLYLANADGTGLNPIASFSASNQRQEGVRVIKDGNGEEHWLTVPWSSNKRFYVNGVEYRMLDLTGVDWKPVSYFADTAGNVWACGRVTSSGVTTAYFYRLITVSSPHPTYFAVTGLATLTSALGDVAACEDPVTGNFVLAWDNGVSGRLYQIDPSTGSVVITANMTLDVYNTNKQFANLPPGSSTIWVNSTLTAYEVRLSDLSVVRTVTPTDWNARDADGLIYDPLSNALITAPQFQKEIAWRYLDRFGGDGVTLGSILGDLAAACGVAEYDFDALDQPIAGWSAVRGSASQMIEPLLDVYDSDIAPVDFAIVGTRRTGVSGGTLSTAWMVPDGERYAVKVRQGTELPRSLTVAFADLEAEQQPNNVRSDRPVSATAARGEETIDMGTLALAPDTARGLADRHFGRLWNSSRTADLALTRQQLALTPGDVRRLDLDGEAWNARLESMTIRADGTIATEWVYDAPDLAAIPDTLGAGADGHAPSSIAFPVPTQAFVLDIPLIADADESSLPVAYAAAAPFGSGAWGGAVIYRDSSPGGDGAFDEDFASFAATAAASWGRTTNALGTAAPTVWDRGNVLNVKMQYGTLASATEDAIDANPRLNLLLVGGELVQFATASLQGDGSYNLSNFKRGRRGTEFAVASHAAGEAVLVMAGAEAEQYEIAEVGTSSRFQAVTFGRGDGFIQTVAFSGASKKPYSPANVRAEKKSNDDWVLSWDRRTRIGAGWGFVDVPLGETSESYELVLGNGSTTVTKTAASASYTFTAADQTTAFGAPVAAGALTFAIYQMSATVGRGFPATGTA
jgi:hypothetical protein